MKEFKFKFRDIDIANVTISRNTIIVNEIYDTKLNPIISNMEVFIHSRLNYSNRLSITRLLKKLGIHDIETYVYKTKAVSFTDCFWASYGSEKWDDININKPENYIGNEYNELAGRPSIYSMTPEPQSGGTFEKCWRKNKNQIYLLKSSSDKWSESSGNESYSEVLCNQLEEFMGVQSYVKYNCKEYNYTYKGDNYKYIISKSLKFTSENKSFIPIEFINTDINSTDDLYDYFCSIGSGKLYLHMVLLDALVMNPDRHTENFGIILDGNLDVIGMAPIFDNNLALAPSVIIKNRTVEQIEKELRFKHPNRHLFDTFFEQGCWILNKDKSMYDMLDKIYHNFRFGRPSGAKSLPDERIAFCNYILHRQISGIINLYKKH